VGVVVVAVAVVGVDVVGGCGVVLLGRLPALLLVVANASCASLMLADLAEV
jgi:hypothetical protein